MGNFCSSGEECKTMFSLCDCPAGGGAGAITIDLCEGTIETGDNCNVGRPSAGWTSDACSQKYLRIGPEESNLAYQCTLGSGANCNSWGSGESPTFCRIPQ